MLVASNEALFDSVVKRKDIEGGFIGRTVIVKESKARRINDLVDPPEHIINFPKLALRLMEVSKIKGEFKWTKDGAAVYRKWYRELMEGEQDEDRTGTINRLGDQVIKVTMLLSLARCDDLEIAAEDLEAATAACEECAGAAVRITPSNESHNGDRPNVGKYIVQALTTAEGFALTKAQLLGRLQPRQILPKDIDSCLIQMQAAGWLGKQVISGEMHINKRTILSLTDEGVDQFVMNKMKPHRVN